MQASFWHEMWASGKVGFHQSDMNEFLTDYWQNLGLTGDETVLVPLCGKSLDMLWLAKQGHKVLGVELSQQALDEFLTENEVTAQPAQYTHYCGYELDNLTLLCGDFFHLTTEDCQDVKAIYDRAAIVALPPEIRAQYVTHLRAILPKGMRYLMITMEYDQSRVSGPPFSVPESEVRQLFLGVDSIEKVHEVSFENKGVPRTEMVFVIQT
jgi:thiopurine S-methyltransferase